MTQKQNHIELYYKIKKVNVYKHPQGATHLENSCEFTSTFRYFCLY